MTFCERGNAKFQESEKHCKRIFSIVTVGQSKYDAKYCTLSLGEIKKKVSIMCDTFKT